MISSDNQSLVHRTHTTQSHQQDEQPDQSSQPTIDFDPQSNCRPPHTNPIRYLLREQRLLFVLIGIAIATLFFSSFPLSNPELATTNDPRFESESGLDLPANPTRRVLYEARGVGFGSVMSAGGKVPLGLKKKNQRIVVTGGAGFVGSHLVDRLIARGDSVIVLDNFFTGRKENLVHHFGNPKFELIRHDVVEPILLEVDQIYHLACPASPVHYKFNPVKTIKTNVVGTLNMLGLAKRVGARFLLTSTSEVYGDPLQHPQVESYWGNVNPIGVRSCYDEGKRTAETLTMDYHRGLGIEVRIARIFNTYGPRMCIDDGRVVSNFVAQALRKEPLTVYGDGKQTRSFQYVSDLVEGLMRLMEGNHVGPFNLGNPGEFTMLELAQVVQDTIDPNAKIEFRPSLKFSEHFLIFKKLLFYKKTKLKMSGYPHQPPGYGYGSTPPPGKPYAAPQPGQPGQPGQYQAQPYGAPAAPYGAPSAPYGAPSAPYAAPYAPEKPHQSHGSSGPYAPEKPQSHGSSGGGYPPSAPGYGSPFAALVPSSFPPGTDPNVVACFQMADQDGSGFIDDKELQRALSSYNQSFSLRTVHLLMYLFTQTNTRKIGPKEFTAVFYSLQSWRGIFERFDRDRSGHIDATELRDALLSLGFAVSPTVLDLLVSKFDKTGGKHRAIEYDNFIECCLTVKGLTEKFKEKDKAYTGTGTFSYEDFMLTVLPFLIA